MSCSSCKSGASALPMGCKNNGTCGTGGCNKTNSYNWLSDIILPEDQEPFSIYEISYRMGKRKGFCKNGKFRIQTGDKVVVKTDNGYDIGMISLSGELVKLQMKKRNVVEENEEILPIMRKASPKDLDYYNSLQIREKESLIRARSIAYAEKLEMKIGDMEFRGDGKKVTFYYTAEGRVDFRELIKIYAKEFKAKVEMRQIGLRQEAALIGGIGDCGRELCCTTWLHEYKAVSTTAARYQNLAINQTKLSGQCGRLKCCLNYELDSYLDALQHFPENAEVIHTKKGKAILQKTDIFKHIMYYAYEGNFAEFHPLHISAVKNLLSMSSKQRKPASLEGFEMKPEIEEEKEETSDSFYVKALDEKKPEQKTGRRNKKKRYHKRKD